MITGDDVRRIALALPETTERPSYGTTGFRVKDRVFARIHQDGASLVLWCAGEEEKESLLLSVPEVFFTAPHYDGHALVLVRMDAVGAVRLGQLLSDAWEVRAPARVRAARGAGPS